jgi:hypothetical protein
MGSELRRVSIDEFQFLEAFGRDVDYHDVEPLSVYLDFETGKLLWVYDDDERAYGLTGIPPEDNAAERERVEASPDRYLEIPGLDHGDHHEILREFLDSDWTDDADAWRWAREAYIGSIGKWKRAVHDEKVVHAFYDFRDGAIKDSAEQFLREHGVEAQWT